MLFSGVPTQINLPKWALVILNYFILGLIHFFLEWENVSKISIPKHLRFTSPVAVLVHLYINRLKLLIHYYYYNNNIKFSSALAELPVSNLFALTLPRISILKFWMVSSSDSITSYFVTIHTLFLLMLLYFLLPILAFVSFLNQRISGWF